MLSNFQFNFIARSLHLVNRNLRWGLLRCHQLILRSLHSELQLRKAWVLKLSKSGPCLLQLFLAPSNPCINATGHPHPTGPELFTLEPTKSPFERDDIILSHKLLTATESTSPQALINAVINSITYGGDSKCKNECKGINFLRPCSRRFSFLT